MKKWISCCFPKTIDDLSNDDRKEYKNFNIFQAPENNQINNQEENNNDIIQNNNINNKIPQLQQMKTILDVPAAQPVSENETTNNINTINNNSNNVEEYDVKNTNNNNNDIIFSYLCSNREITDEEIKNSPTLSIKEEEGSLFSTEDNEIKINAGGLIKGGRNAKDGLVLFGNNESFKNDMELNLININDKEVYKKYPYIFAIYYRKSNKNYYIRACEGEGKDNKILFIRLTKGIQLPLLQGELLFIGDCIFQVVPIENYQIEITILTKKNINCDCEEKKVFNNGQIITIGRDTKATYCFKKNKAFSRIQTTIYFDNDKKTWILIDGCKDKESSNGSWLFGLHSFLIQDGLVVEILTSKIKFHINNNN